MNRWIDRWKEKHWLCQCAPTVDWIYLAISICSFLALGSFISCNTESKYRTARWVWYFSF